MKTSQCFVAPGDHQSTLAALAWRAAAVLMLGLPLAAAAAAVAPITTDISNTPINSTRISLAKPNIMLLMDTSKSILFTHAPNALEGTATPPLAPQPIGYRANQCNSIYYSPTTPYKLPVDANGANLPTPSFSAAPYNYYSPSNLSSPAGLATVDLNSQFQAFDKSTRARNSTDANDLPQRAYYYVYTTTANVTPAALDYAAAPCTDAYGHPTGAAPHDPSLSNTYSTTATTGGSWKRVLVGPVGTPGVTVDETQNFAIWYTYYRTRVALTKSGIGLAFSPLSDHFRVGLINGNPLTKASPDAKPEVGAAVDPAAYLALADFTPAQRADWYAKLYAQVPGGSSPMREGLARVGRHYANKDDLINNGMKVQASTDDHSCRQNFTIMTTGGYWSQYAETLGPVKIDGTTKVGEQDGVESQTVSVNGVIYDVAPRPIWDGQTSGTIVTTDKWNTYSAASCVTGQVTKSTEQKLASTVLKKKSTSQITTFTKTTTKTTHQMRKRTSQDLQQTLQTLRTTTQGKAHTVAYSVSTSQATKTISYVTSTVTTPTQRTYQRLMTTSSTLKKTSQRRRSTAQMQVSTSQAKKTTQTTTKATSQRRQSTSQLQLSTTQPNQYTSQAKRSTHQLQQTTDQSTQSTRQWWATDSQNSTPVANCTPTTEITCTLQTSGPDPIVPGTAPCNAPPTGASTWVVAATADNAYVETTCVNIHTGPVGVISCATATAYLNVSCVSVDTGPTAVEICIPPAWDAYAALHGASFVYNAYLAPGKNYGPGGRFGNQYDPHPGTANWTTQNDATTTSCSTVNTGPTPVASCAYIAPTAGNSWITTTCTPVTTGPTPVASCLGNTDASFITTTCNTVTTGPTGVSSCTPSGDASISPYLLTTCDTKTTSDTVAPGPDNCTNGTDSNYVVTTCTTTTVGPDPVKAGECTAGTVGAVTTTCPVTTSGPTPANSSCTSSGNVNDPPYLVTTCNNVTTGPTGVSSCTESGNVNDPPYLVTSCDTATTSDTVAPANCKAGTDANYVVTTCTTTPIGPTPIPATASCVNGTVGSVTTSCTFNISAYTAVASCTPSTGTAPDYIDIECSTSTGAAAASDNCVPITGVTDCTAYSYTIPTTTPCLEPTPSAPLWLTTVCNAPTTTGPTAVEKCTLGVTGSATVDPYLVTTCVDLGGTLGYVAQPCSNVSAKSTLWVATVCENPPVVTGPTGVETGTCIPDPGTSSPFLKVECTDPVTTWVPVRPESCNHQRANDRNGWTTINCKTDEPDSTLATSITGTTFNCTQADATAPDWIKTTCTAKDVGPTAVNPNDPKSCVSATSAGLTTTTVCDVSQSAAVPQNATNCAGLDVAATDPNWTATVCNTVTTGPTAQDPTQCAADAAVKPSFTNGYVTTTCDTFTTTAVPVASCTESGANSANGYVATTCPAAITTGPTQVAAAACTAYIVGGVGTTAATDLAQQYINTTCTAVDGKKVQYVATTKVATQTVSGSTKEGNETVVTTPGTLTDLDGVCYTAAQQPALFATPAFSAGGAPKSPDIPPAVRPPAIPAGVPTKLTSLGSAPTSPCTAWPCAVSSGSAQGGSSNSLADVAQYYYVTDLRPEMVDNVFVGGGTGIEDDRLKSQHMTTFVVGLGVSGTLAFNADYQNSANVMGDFPAIRTGLASDSYIGATGQKNWPIWPTASTTNESQFNDARSIDDFWHTAVNGRGRFFSARDPGSLIDGISGSLSSIDKGTGSGAGATTATQTPVAGNNAIFVTGFVTGKWTGDVQAKTFSATGVSATSGWYAQTQLNSLVSFQCDKRDIRLIRPGATDKLVRFTWNTRVCDNTSPGAPTGAAGTELDSTEQAFFGAAVSDTLSQFAASGSATADQRTAAAGANLVNYLRGQKGYENYIAADVNHLYRVRDSALGDIVNSQLTYVPPPSQLYADEGYSTFRSDHAARPPMAYVGANDGMLHAFYAPADTTAANAGKEAWAVIPTAVLPNLYALSDVAYGSHHQYFVDGSPIAGDVDTSNGAGTGWKTILVGGLGGGGKGYYALDITDPTTPKALWEFKASSSGCAVNNAAAVRNTSDCNLGLTFGRPIITKLANQWVVLVTSGYNNNTGAGDGQGYLYVLNAATGEIIRRIGTGVGDTGTASGSVGPSGLRELTTYVSNPVQNNMALRVYGGDLLGNLWRFDINSGDDRAVLVTTLTAPDGTAQPITTRVNLAEVDGKTFLMVGTGRLLGISDIGNPQQQTVYSIKDPLTTPATTTSPTAEIAAKDLRATLKKITLTSSGTLLDKNLSRSALTCVAATDHCNSDAGWYLDLTQGLSDSTLGSERVTFDMGLALGTLAFQTNIPSATPCSTGYNLFNELDFVSGRPVTSDGLVTTYGSDALASGATLVQFAPGSTLASSTSQCGVTQIVMRADGTIGTHDVACGVPPPVGKRISWREIAQ